MEIKVFIVDGMSCQHCVKAVTNALTEINGVSNVDISLSEKKVSVTVDSSVVSDDEIKAAIEDAGYDVV